MTFRVCGTGRPIYHRARLACGISSFRIRSSVLAPLIAVALAGSVLGGVGPFASSARADDPQRAKELYQEGTRFFDLGQFDKAIDAFQSGYREKPDPIFLYNIAQAYRLAGDANKAMFFYKGYLRNSPKAHNRADVEQKIQALQKQVGRAGAGAAPDVAADADLDAGHRQHAAADSAPAAAAPPPAATPAPVRRRRRRRRQQRLRRPPRPAPSDTPASDTMSGPPTLATAPTPQRARRDAPHRHRRSAWASTAGRRACRARPTRRWRWSCRVATRSATTRPRSFTFALGGSLGYTFLKDTTSRDTFLSALVVPTHPVPREPSAWRSSVELGIGIVGVSGMQANSVLLDPKLTLKLSGTQSLLEIRPALGVQYQLTDGVGVFGALAIDYSPKGNHFYQAISRTELLVGLTLRF